MISRFRNVSFLVAVLLLCACTRHDPREKEVFEVVIRINSFPETHNPLYVNHFYNSSILNKIYESLVRLDDVTNKHLSHICFVHNVAKENSVFNIDFTIRPEASWNNGTPVTVKDVLNTLKIYNLPGLRNKRRRLDIAPIRGIDYDKEHDRSFSLTVEGNFDDVVPKMANFSILPSHLFDPKGYLDDIELHYLMNNDPAVTREDERILRFENFFESDSVQESLMSAEAAYKISQWRKGQYVILEKVPEWWGFKVSDPTVNLINRPDFIKYEVIPDQSVALLALQNGSIDVLADISPAEFLSMQSDSISKEKFHFLSPVSFQFYYLAFNTRLGKLNIDLRKAIEYLVPFEEIVRVAVFGLGQRTIGPVNPVDTAYYNNSLPLIESNDKNAAEILSAAEYFKSGETWTDRSGEALELRLIYPAGSEEYENIALIIKDKLNSFGIELSIESVETSLHSKRLRNHDFELAIRALRGGPLAHNFAPIFSRQAANIGGLNFSGFGSLASDSVIDLINNTDQSEVKIAAMRELQRMLYTEKTMLFLFFSKDRIVVSRKFTNVRGFSRSPGFDVSLFQLADEPL